MPYVDRLKMIHSLAGAGTGIAQGENVGRNFRWTGLRAIYAANSL